MMIKNQIWGYPILKQPHIHMFGVTNWHSDPEFPTADGCAPAMSSPICVPWLRHAAMSATKNNGKNQKPTSVEGSLENIQIHSNTFKSLCVMLCKMLFVLCNFIQRSCWWLARWPKKMQLRAPSQHREVPLWSDPLPPTRSHGNRKVADHPKNMMHVVEKRS